MFPGEIGRRDTHMQMQKSNGRSDTDASISANGAESATEKCMCG